MSSGGTGGLRGASEGSLWSCRGFVVAGVCSAGAGGLRDAPEGSLRPCSPERAFPSPLSAAGGWGDSERDSLDCAWYSYESTPFIRLDAIFANGGAGEDDDGDMEALDRSKGGGGVEGLAGGRTEAVRLTGSALSPVEFLSLDEGGGG